MNFVEKRITYFEVPGSQNTDTVLQLAKKRAEELGIRDIVVASTSGETGLRAAQVFQGLKSNLIAVTFSGAFAEEGTVLSEEKREALEKKGVRVLMCTHALGDDVDRAFTNKYGGSSYKEAVARTLRIFSQGMKVCVEITLMAADSGLIDVSKEIIAIAGTDHGADTAVVIKPSYPRKFFDLKVREIIAKPR